MRKLLVFQHVALEPLGTLNQQFKDAGFRIRYVNFDRVPGARVDLETLLSRLAPDGDPAYRHDTEGPDDMAAHARSVLTSNALTIPVTDGRLALGTWQGLYLWEHRHAGHARRVVVTVTGEG